ncbi:MAG: hypothetical protein JWQ10_4077 [Herbaspirillum sp.]|nr:hypothetical protein [Herbaspirillum sp.]
MDLTKLMDQVDLDNKANTLNDNAGTSGTNRIYDQAQGNRGKQKNPNQTQPTPVVSEDMDEGDVYGGWDSSD